MGCIAGIIKVITPKSARLGECEISGHEVGKIKKLLCCDFAYVGGFSTCKQNFEI